jgi:hypothetical protein
VPSFPHEVLVDLFRSGAELAPALLDACAHIVLPHTRVDHTSIDLSQVTSTEYRADAVVVLRDDSPAPVAAIIVEVQRHVDRSKRRSWPVYITTLSAKLECPVYLLVLAPDPAVARWARAPIALGHPGFRLEPLVIEYAELPRVTDPDEALRLPELAVLSAMAHPDLAVATTAVSAIHDLSEDRAKLYYDLILEALSPSLREELRMQGYVYQSEFARKYLAEGREEGRKEALRGVVFALLQAKLGVVTDDDNAAIEAVHDVRVLTELIDVLIRATSAAEVRAALTALRVAG